MVRNAYWAVANRLRFVAFLNYRLGQMRAGVEHEAEPSISEAISTALAETDGPPVPRTESELFDPASYSVRDRTYLRAEPALIENQVMLRRERLRDFERFLRGLTSVVDRCTEDCRVLLVIVPHKSQVHPRYLERSRLLGAEFSEEFRRGEQPYPFLRETAAFVRDRGWAQVEIVDALEHFRRLETEGLPLYYMHDSHLNTVGQAVLARLILERLEPTSASTVE